MDDVCRIWFTGQKQGTTDFYLEVRINNYNSKSFAPLAECWKEKMQVRVLDTEMKGVPQYQIENIYYRYPLKDKNVYSDFHSFASSISFKPLLIATSLSKYWKF